MSKGYAGSVMGKDLVSEYVNTIRNPGGSSKIPLVLDLFHTFRNSCLMKFNFLWCFCSPFVNKKHPRWENSTRGLLGWTLDASCWQSMERRCGGRSGAESTTIRCHRLQWDAMKNSLSEILMGKPSRIQKWTIFHCHVWLREGTTAKRFKTHTSEFHQILGVNTHGTGRWRPTATYPCGKGAGSSPFNRVLDSIHVFWVLHDHRLS